MNFLDFLIKIREIELIEKKYSNDYISNRLACFLMLNSKGQKFYTGTKEKYLKEEIYYETFFKYEGSGELEDKIVDLIFKSYFRNELKKAFENPKIEYEKRMQKAKENYLEYIKEVELRRLFSS